MSDEGLRVEFRVEMGMRRPAPKPEPEAKAERQRAGRAARQARNLALAYWIDRLIKDGEANDLAAVAKMCHVSRARVSQLVAVLATTTLDQELAVLGIVPGAVACCQRYQQSPPPRQLKDHCLSASLTALRDASVRSDVEAGESR